MNTILEVQGLKKIYMSGKGEKQTILNGIDLKITAGEFVAIMGSSGSGKSTFLYNISGMDKPTEGRVVLLGKEITNLDEKELSEIRLKNMGFVFQQPYLIKNLVVQDNIVLAASLFIKNNDALRKKADAIMDMTGIQELAQRDVNTLSGGQAQRVGICRALINQPQILFCDEPTGALNSKTSNEIMDIFASIHEDGTTIMLVTHDSKVAARADRVLFMIDGKIACEINLGKWTGDRTSLLAREGELFAKLTEIEI